jgi:hypothetical protein
VNVDGRRGRGAWNSVSFDGLNSRLECLDEIKSSKIEMKISTVEGTNIFTYYLKYN